MKIAGLNKCSLIDYPGKVAAVVFTRGCNLRCGYCHNPQLVYHEQYGELFPDGYVLDFLRSRIGKLDGVVVTGGEPLLQPGLEKFMFELKRMGYLVKLDTNGTHPKLLQRLTAAGLCDYVAMDIKAPAQKYSQVCGVQCDFAVIQESIGIIENSGIEYNFRTTFSEDFLTVHDIDIIKTYLKSASKYIVQDCLSRPAVRFA